MKRARHQPTMDERRQRKQAMSGTERSRRSRERKAAEDATKQDRNREWMKAETKVTAAREGIRKGVDPTDAYLQFRDREGSIRDVRELLITDTFDIPLEDERQAQAEADGTWPEFTVTDSQ